MLYFDDLLLLLLLLLILLLFLDYPEHDVYLLSVSAKFSKLKTNHEEAYMVFVASSYLHFNKKNL